MKRPDGIECKDWEPEKKGERGCRHYFVDPAGIGTCTLPVRVVCTEWQKRFQEAKLQQPKTQLPLYQYDTDEEKALASIEEEDIETPEEVLRRHNAAKKAAEELQARLEELKRTEEERKRERELYLRESLPEHVLGVDIAAPGKPVLRVADLVGTVLDLGDGRLLEIVETVTGTTATATTADVAHDLTFLWQRSRERARRQAMQERIPADDEERRKYCLRHPFLRYRLRLDGVDVFQGRPSPALVAYARVRVAEDPELVGRRWSVYDLGTDKEEVLTVDDLVPKQPFRLPFTIQLLGLAEIGQGHVGSCCTPLPPAFPPCLLRRPASPTPSTPCYRCARC